ncbi:MAG: S9 family peptidase [Bacteroidota bacterium]
MRKYLLLLSITLLISACKTEEPEAELIPLKDFFRNPEKTHFQLSPNGEYIAYLKTWKNRLNLFTEEIETKKITQVTQCEGRDIPKYYWVSNNKLVYVKDVEGNDYYSLFAVDVKGENHIQLTTSKNSSVSVIDPLETNADEAIIRTNIRNEKAYDVYRINVNTGKMKIIAENPGNITHWLTDHNGLLRVAVASDGVNSAILYRDNESEQFRIVSATDFKEMLFPIWFTPDNKYVYARSNLNRDKAAIVIYDLINDREKEVVYEHHQVDVDYIMVSKESKRLTGAVYITWKYESIFFDEDWQNLQRELQSFLPGMDFIIESTSNSDIRVLVKTISDQSMGSYYYYDRKSKEFSKLSDISPWLEGKDLSPMKSIQFKSRDGLTIPGYLTIPKGVKSKNLPTVVIPHGGPWTRDYWRFNSEVQFLVNRGYAVLQLNFRGSHGYGRKFSEAGFKEWGNKIQNDVADGVKWLVKQEIADPNRIAIYGASFGGYSALCGLAFHPELYACGVSYVGFPNLFAFLNSVPPTWEPFKEMLYEMVGNPVKDSLLLHNASPIFFTENIKVPVLFANGANDNKVRLKDVEFMMRTLKNNGVDVTYMLKDNEGHGFKNEENRIEFYRTLEQFLSKNIMGRKEVINL